MENPISITMLNDFVFCPVSIYFHNLYQGVEKNLYQGKSQINGTKAHETIDNCKSLSFCDIIATERIIKYESCTKNHIDVINNK